MPITSYPVEIDVSTCYLAKDSEPNDNYYLFNYHITIYNRGDKDITILSRHWTVTDGNGHKKEIKGTGINGKQPFIGMGHSFDYNGSSNLPTPVGSIQATYLVELDTGDQLEVFTKPLSLAVPGILQ